MAYTTDPPAKKGAVLHFKHGATKKKFKAADLRTGAASYGPESKTAPTPDFVKKAQSAGVDLAEKDGKSYRAGYTSMEKTPDQHKVHTELSGKIPAPHKSQYEVMQNKKKMSEIHQASGTAKKRRLPRVDWLAGKNKRTESGFGK